MKQLTFRTFLCLLSALFAAAKSPVAVSAKGGPSEPPALGHCLIAFASLDLRHERKRHFGHRGSERFSACARTCRKPPRIRHTGSRWTTGRQTHSLARAGCHVRGTGRTLGENPKIAAG